MTYLLPNLLVNSAQKFPDATAVSAGSESITYRELDRITSRLAAVLSANGVARGDRVGIFAPKSIGAIAAIHAILKVGAVYVPVDPDMPPARAAYIAENCGIRCLLTSARKSSALSEMLSKKGSIELVVLIDDATPYSPLPVPVIEWRDVVAGEGDAPPLEASERDLAYILYTSGSTGVPKGVMISHLNALTFVDWAHETVGVRAGDRVSSHAPLHFDLSIFDIFAAFKAGSTLVLVPDGLSSFPFRLAEWIEQNEISIWYSVPTILSMLVRHGDLSRFRYSRLRTIIFAGEVFPVKYLRELMANVPHAVYYNFYGPTETNVITYYRVPPLPLDRTAPIPIGKACANVDVFALTEEGGVVERRGEVGELYARGSCVALGYWGDEEKTRRTFVPDPLRRGPAGPGETVYRTGDIVTRDDEGNYLFLGRRDDMVKSRGYRIELGEVESALYRHGSVREAAVVAVPDTAAGNRLIAFVVLDDGAELSSTHLQDFCLESIPRYMVPDTIEFRENLPKTSTGKVDKVALTRDVPTSPTSGT